MRALRHRLLLSALAAGLSLGVLPAAVPAADGVTARSAQAARTVSLELSRDSVPVGGTFDVTGQVARTPAGTSVHVQRGAEGSWVTIGTTHTTSAAGAFALDDVIASKAGAFLYRAVVPGAGSTATVSSGYSWLVATAKSPATIVSGYVQAGGPVAGSTVRISLPGRAEPVRTTSSRNGFFLARLPGLPKSLRVEATGGTGPTGKFVGTMKAIVANPTTHDSFYLNPASTLVAAYLDTHRGATRGTAMARVRGLLGLEKYHNLDWALGGRPSYFDSVEFLRTAESHGGFDVYVAHLVKQLDRTGARVTFRNNRDRAPASRAGDQGSAIVGLIGPEAAGYLGVASQGASIVNAGLGLMTLIGGLVGWSPSSDTTSSQILSAIDQVQSTLTAIQTQIADLSADLQDDFKTLSLKSDQNAYNNAVGDLLDAYQAVSNVQADYADYVNNQDIVASPSSSPAGVALATSNLANELSDYRADIKILESYIGRSSDVFHDAIRPNQVLSTTPALDFLVDKYLDTTDDLFLPAGSTLVEDFTATALTNQAWAYYLVMAYERSLVPAGTTPPAGGTIDQISTSYLGPDYEDWPQYVSPNDPPTTPTGAPTAGNLHDEMSYLGSVLPVPEWMTVDTDQGGQMYMSSSRLGLGSTLLPSDPASRARCVQVADYASGYRDYPVSAGGSAPNGGTDSQVCTALADPLNALNSTMITFPSEEGSYWAADATQGEPAGTYASGLDTGWGPVFLGELGMMLPRLAAVGAVSAQYYFDPGAPVWFPNDSGVSGEHNYWVQTGTYLQCADANGGPQCSPSSQTYVGPVIDWLKLYFKTLSGSDVACTWAVGQSNTNTDECFDMPILLSRPLQSGEVYVPQ